MKKLITIFAVLVLTPGFALAERFDIAAKIGKIRYHEGSNTLATSWQDFAWISLEQPNASPDCATYEGKYIVSIPGGNNQILTMALTAKMADKQVLVTIDDDVKSPDGNTCKLQYFTIVDL